MVIPYSPVRFAKFHMLWQLKMKRQIRQVRCEHCLQHFAATVISRHIPKCHSNPEYIKKYTKDCPECKKPFLVIGKDLNVRSTCSYTCANTFFEKGHKIRHLKQYRTICFRWHAKQCVVCREKNIVTVHHFDENRENNDPTNLIPLCPTHHQYCHSRFKKLIFLKIERYHKQFKEGYLRIAQRKNLNFGSRRPRVRFSLCRPILITPY